MFFWVKREVNCDNIPATDPARGRWNRRGDIDGDAFPDLITSNSWNSTFTVLPGQGDGSFGSFVNYRIGETPTSVATADFNGDGIMDLVAGKSENDYAVSVLLGLGNGAFGGARKFGIGACPT